jgi:NAD(P)-dependent dehydrogenase (short-subunit alcohol dehydrogenase family)
MRLMGRVAIVTGAARGIGYGTVKKFLQEGARVAFCDIHEADVRRAEKELSAFGEVRGYVVDITDAERDKAFAADVVRDFGTIDILINNAGINADRQFYKMTLDAHHDGKTVRQDHSRFLHIADCRQLWPEQLWCFKNGNHWHDALHGP